MPDPTSPDALRAGAIDIVTTLRHAGHDAFFVGGSVRDRLLGRPVREIDIATSATPTQVQRLFRRTVPVGVQFGVILVVSRHGEYEVATFRAETRYSDGRRPDAVRFVSAREDVFRRDFTINGLLEDPITGEIRDFVDGERDLQRRLIRAIGAPDARFQEDHLRILRAIRFSAVLGFSIEPETHAAIVRMATSVASVAPERVHHELSRAFSEGDPRRAFTLLWDTGVLATVLPESTPKAHTADALAALGPAPFPLILATLLQTAGPDATDAPLATPEIGTAVAARLRLSRDDRRLLEYLLTARPRFAEPLTTAQTLRFIRAPMWPALARVYRAEQIALGADLTALDHLQSLLDSLRPEALHPPRLLTGADLKALGLTPGPAFKDILTALEDAQLEARLQTRADAEAFVKTLF